MSMGSATRGKSVSRQVTLLNMSMLLGQSFPFSDGAVKTRLANKEFFPDLFI